MDRVADLVRREILVVVRLCDHREDGQHLLYDGLNALVGKGYTRLVAAVSSAVCRISWHVS